MGSKNAAVSVRAGRILKAARLAAGLSRAAVARATGISQSAIQYYEVGVDRTPSLARALALARLYGLNVGDFAPALPKRKKGKRGQ